MVDVSRLLGAAPTATVASSSRSGGGAGHVKKANKKMLGMTAHSHGVAVGTVVSVDTASGVLLVRDGDAQHEWIHIANVTLTGSYVKPTKLIKEGGCPGYRYE